LWWNKLTTDYTSTTRPDATHTHTHTHTHRAEEPSATLYLKAKPCPFWVGVFFPRLLFFSLKL